MFTRSFSRLAASSGRHARNGVRRYVSSPVDLSLPLSSTAKSAFSHCRPSGCCVVSLPQPASLGRFMSSSRPPHDSEEEENEVDVTPLGDKPWQITPEAVAEAEAADDIGDADFEATRGPSDWEFDAPTEAELDAEAEGGDDENPPTPILDAYERSRDPAEMERLIKMAFDSLPERAGPQRYNHKRREHQRYKTIRNIKYKEKAQRMAAHERKLQKRRDRKTRELALFATWRGTEKGDSSVAKQ